jgi:hypothetical protein
LLSPKCGLLSPKPRMPALRASDLKTSERINNALQR